MDLSCAAFSYSEWDLLFALECNTAFGKQQVSPLRDFEGIAASSLVAVAPVEMTRSFTTHNQDR